MKILPVIGQEMADELLDSAINRHRIAPAYLFAGPNGVGKKLMALTFAYRLLGDKIINNNHPDLMWVEPTYLHNGKFLSPQEAIAAGLKRRSPPEIRLEQIREVGQFLSTPPMEGSRSLVIIDQAESLSEKSGNGLLKTLEEPKNATLILLVSSSHAILPTIVSRCQKIPFIRLSMEKLIQVLTQVGKTDIVSNEEILRIAGGSPGEAIAANEEFSKIPGGLLERLKYHRLDIKGSLELAKEIDDQLEWESQIWLIDYLCYYYWYDQLSSTKLRILDKARQSLLYYAAPRLVWEVTLWSLNS